MAKRVASNQLRIDFEKEKKTFAMANKYKSEKFYC